MLLLLQTVSRRRRLHLVVVPLEVIGVLSEIAAVGVVVVGDGVVVALSDVGEGWLCC